MNSRNSGFQNLSSAELQFCLSIVRNSDRQVFSAAVPQFRSFSASQDFRISESRPTIRPAPLVPVIAFKPKEYFSCIATTVLQLPRRTYAIRYLFLNQSSKELNHAQRQPKR